MPALLTLSQIHVRGTPAELGRGQGEQLKPLIGAFVAQRLRAAKVYLHERGIRDEQTFRDLGRRCLAALKEWDLDGWINIWRWQKLPALMRSICTPPVI